MYVGRPGEYSVKLTRAELRVVGLALAGKLKGDDVAAAQELSERLLAAWEHALEEELGVVRGALRRAEERRTEPLP